MRPDLTLLPLLALPAVVAGFAFFLRGWPRAPQIIVAVAAILIGYLTIAAPVGMTGELAGRTLVLDAAAKRVFLIALGTAALGNLVLAIYPVDSLFPPIAALAASIVGVTAALDNLTLASLSLAIAAAILVMAWRVHGTTRGHLQYLVAVILGTVLLAYAATAIEANPEARSRTTLLAFELGAGLLLALIPFGFWELSLARDADALPIALAGLTLKSTALILVWRFSAQHAWLAAASPFADILRIGALATVGYCALRAAVASSPGVYAAAASQGQFGLVVLTLLPALGSAGMLPVTGLALLARVPTVIFLSAIATFAPTRLGRDSRLLFALGAAAMLGVPGTPLFAAHLSGLLTLTRADDLFVPLALLAGGLAIGAARSTAYGDGGADPEQRLPLPALLAAVVMLLIVVGIGLRPSLLYALLG